MFDLLSNLKYGMKLLEPRQLYAGISVYHGGDISMSVGLATLSEIKRLESESFSDIERTFYSYTPEKDVFSLLRDALSQAVEFYKKRLERQMGSFLFLPAPVRHFDVNDYVFAIEVAIRSAMRDSLMNELDFFERLRKTFIEIDEMEKGDIKVLKDTCREFLNNLNESGLLSLYRTTPEGDTP